MIAQCLNAERLQCRRREAFDIPALQHFRMIRWAHVRAPRTHIDMTDRREFLQLSAAAMATAAFPFSTRAVETSATGWYDKPMRWAQLTLVEDDPGKYDPQFWLDYFKRTHSDAACLSAGGCVAYYPTKVPLHHRSRFLGDRDSFGELVAGCRKLGMNVIARTDPHAAHQDVYDAHPDWIAVDAEGRRRKHWADPELWVTCALGPYNFEFMTEVTREIVSLYRVDGIFSNRWSGSGMCFCEHCQSNFRKFSGLDLPRTPNPQDRSRRQYIVWHQQRLFELWRLWDGEIKKINPAASYIANAGGGALSGLDMKTIGELAPTLFADRQARRGVMPPWSNGKNGKEYTATHGQQGHRRHLQHGRRGALPLEGLGAARRRDTAVGRRRHRPQSPAMVHQVQRQGRGRTLDESRRGHLRLALAQRAVSAQRAVAGARGDGVLAADRVLLRWRPRPGQGRGSRAGLLPCAGPGAHPVRHGARPTARRCARWPLPDTHSAEHRCAVGDAVPPAH